MASLIGFSFSKRALEDLEAISSRERAQVIKKAKALMLDPRPNGYIQMKGVKSNAGEPVFRDRSGDYRIFYVVRKNPETVVILGIGNRKDVYR